MTKYTLTKTSVLGMAQLIGLDISEQRAIELQPHLQRLLNLAKEHERLALSTTEPDFRFDPERM